MAKSFMLGCTEEGGVYVIEWKPDLRHKEKGAKKFLNFFHESFTSLCGGLCGLDDIMQLSYIVQVYCLSFLKNESNVRCRLACLFGFDLVRFGAFAFSCQLVCTTSKPSTMSRMQSHARAVRIASLALRRFASSPQM